MSPKLVNLGKVKEYISIVMRPFREAESKAMRACVESGQYDTLMESCDF